MKDFPTESDPFQDRRVMRRLKAQKIQADLIDLYGQKPPAEFKTDYPLDDEGLARNETLQKKYISRERNIRRSWNRTQLYLPELMRGPARDVLELSTAHGGMLEVAHYFGHTVMGSDFANMVYRRNNQPMAVFRDLNDQEFTRETDDHGIRIDAGGTNDWPYRHIIESIDLPMTIFDGGKTPYPFADDSYDVVMSFQAIEHYCHPKGWMDVVAEMCRISRRTVFLMINPMHPRLNTDETYEPAFEAFRLAMRDFDRNGFGCVATFINWNQALGFKLMTS